MADSGWIGGRSGAPGGVSGRSSASEARPPGADGSGAVGSAALLSLVEAAEAVEEGLEMELAEARRETDELRARLAAVEAALVSFAALVDAAALTGVEAGSVWHPVIHDLGKRIRSRLDEIGQRAALGSVVRAAVDAERAAIRARVEALTRHGPGRIHGSPVMPRDEAGRWVFRDDVLTAIGGAS